MVNDEIEYKISQPDNSISRFVERFWMLANHSEKEKEIVVIPDGRIDIFFSYSATEPFHITLMGLDTKPTQTFLPARSVTFALNLKPFAIEYLFDFPVSELVDMPLNLPSGFLGITQTDLDDFDTFCDKVSKEIVGLLPQTIDERKQKLFELLYSTNGSLKVKEYSEEVHWSSRQINRYFNQQFGLPLKEYCNILRFRASFQHIKDGRLYPEQNFTDQAHFIKEVKRLSGVVPKELFRNQNDRFLQLSTLPKK